MEVTQMKLLGHYQIIGKIICLTGLRIGGGSETIEIGGLDNPVIKHPITRQPYIPGSSLKGKMRSLLELKLGKIEPNGEVHKYSEGCGLNCPICRIFGVSAGEGSPFGPGRLIVRDCHLEELPHSGELTTTEIKWENVINRISGTAKHPRSMERVPAGAEFALHMDYRIFELGVTEGGEQYKKDEDLLEFVFQAMKLVQMDTLGGSGSRGYGKIRFEELNKIDLDGNSEPIDLEVISFEAV